MDRPTRELINALVHSMRWHVMEAAAQGQKAKAAHLDVMRWTKAGAVRTATPRDLAREVFMVRYHAATAARAAKASMECLTRIKEVLDVE
jgi:hypothetical protein